MKTLVKLKSTEVFANHLFEVAPIDRQLQSSVFGLDRKIRSTCCEICGGQRVQNDDVLVISESGRTLSQAHGVLGNSAARRLGGSQQPRKVYQCPHCLRVNGKRPS